MNIFITKLVPALTVYILATVFPIPVAATTPKIVNTAILDSAAGKEETISIAANKFQKSTASASFQFRLNSLPTGVQLKDCSIRAVMSEKTNRGDDNGVLLQLFNKEKEKQIASINVKPETSKETAIVFRSRNLCESLKSEQSGTASFVLQTTTRNGEIQIYSPRAVSRSFAPRLLLGYELPNASPGDSDWSQIRRDAQHSGRSLWRIYDPDGQLTPTEYKLSPLGKQTNHNLRQSPLLHGGRIFSVQIANINRYSLVAMEPSGRVLGKVDLSDKPKFLTAGGQGWLLYIAENKILGYELTAGALFSQPKVLETREETVLEVPTVGANGSLYVVTDKKLHAYSGFPNPTELWSFPTERDNVGAIALSDDEKTAYMLFGEPNPSLLAIDSATGDCLWQQQIKSIIRGKNESMPIPVVAGHDILVTGAFPTSDSLYVFHDEDRPVDPNTGELIPPSPLSCRASKAPKSMEIRGQENDHIPAPMAGTGQEAFYILGGKLCGSRETESCSELAGCQIDAIKKITLLLGDSSGGGNNVTHLYGLAAESQQLFFINLKWKDSVFSPSCRMVAPGNLGPNLVLAPDGTLYNIDNENLLQAIIPTSFPDAASKLTLTEDILNNNNDSAFRVQQITTAPGLSLPANTDIILIAGQSIGFKAGFSVKLGARLRARVGF